MCDDDVANSTLATIRNYSIQFKFLKKKNPN